MTETETPARTALYDRHVELRAKFAEFGGFEMPLQYQGVVAEHEAVREQVGLFDVSHLGKVRVTGPGARAFVDSCLTNALEKIGPGEAQYTLCCDESGGVVDDLIVYLRSDEELLLVPNAANTTEVIRRLEAAAPDEVEIRDERARLSILALQGPNSDAVLSALWIPVGHSYMSFVDAEFNDVPITVCRTGYTGERGYEIIAASDSVHVIWDALLASGEPQGITPCGLGARDTLRTEMGYPLHGQDLSREISPLQGRSGWAVGWSKPAFWGRDALLEEKEAGPKRRLRGIRATGRGIPRPGMVVTVGGAEVGVVTSGTFSPTLKQGIGLALLPRDVSDGDEVGVDIRGRSETFEVVRPPFVKTSPA
ncbi:glycine cleavage system aminomethyltransferase GcvT [Phytoactinopolyspora halotolerans]|uniref:Aminomethyltransferase n=1 Tax=Phytoactinopolyspora halotolerans TaxID=1981512 RepID=A0A6L9S8J3_9ACTN|nr:glycine cleavage system aminomethyltransferase GcvT [Phytoactinopolyspora halotolerans]NEE01765.1 glycine cleavage system aminomethyltransferase GcvT [Phytoactinopolyspora halotolerans]